VRLLVDATLSPRVAQALRDNGHDAIHVIDVGLATATDTEIAAHAEAENVIVVTADTDFPFAPRSASRHEPVYRAVATRHRAVARRARTTPRRQPANRAATTSDAVPSFPSDRTTCEFATFRWADAHRA
jgi:hypothetical protein